MRRTGGCRSVVIRTIYSASRSLVVGCLRNRRVAVSRLGTTVHGNIYAGGLFPILYNSTCGGGKVRVLLSTIISCVPDPLSVPPIGNAGPSASRRRAHRTSSGTPLSTLTFGVVTSPFINGLTFFHICSNALRTNACICGSAGNGGRHINHVLQVRTGRHRRMRRTCANSVNNVINLGSAAANSALYSRGRPVVLRGVRFPSPIVSMTIRPGAGTSRRGVNVTLTHLTRRSPAFGIGASTRANRAVVSNVNRLRLSVVISHVSHRFGMSYGINGPRITCHRAVHGSIGSHNFFGHRSNNHNRCNSY